MKSLEFKETATGEVLGVITEGVNSSTVWMIKKPTYETVEEYYAIWKLDSNGSMKLQPRLDVTSDENCYYKSIEDAKEYIDYKEFPLTEYCPECGEDSRIVHEFVVQICEYCGSKLKPCTLCEECEECPL